LLPVVPVEVASSSPRRRPSSVRVFFPVPASPAFPPGDQIVSGMPVRSCLALAGALPVLIPAAVLRSELRENKEIEHFRDSEKTEMLWQDDER
jgi:hypothetical protein